MYTSKWALRVRHFFLSSTFSIGSTQSGRHIIKWSPFWTWSSTVLWYYTAQNKLSNHGSTIRVSGTTIPNHRYRRTTTNPFSLSFKSGQVKNGVRDSNSWLNVNWENPLFAHGVAGSFLNIFLTVPFSTSKSLRQSLQNCHAIKQWCRTIPFALVFIKLPWHTLCASLY